MKSLIVAILITAFNTCCCQVTKFMDFSIEKGELIYQHVFDTTIEVVDASKYYASQPKIKNLQIFDTYITGEFENEILDYRKYGRKWGNTPVLFNNYSFSGKVMIEFKSDKYRVTVFGIKMNTLNARLLPNTDMSTDALKKNRQVIRDSWASDDVLGLFNLFFEDSFSIHSTTKSEW
jgi:hypothetical protein